MKNLNNISILKFLIICFTIASIVSSCKRDKKTTNVVEQEQLPAATQEGKNIFGCMLNDEVWLPKNYNTLGAIPSFFYPTNISYDRVSKILFIDANQITKENNKRSIHLYSKNIINTGQYKLYLEPLDKSTTSYWYRGSQEQQTSIYPISDTVNSNLTITKLDTVNKIISGTFSFDFNLNNNNIKVRNGVFDLIFK